MKITDNKLNGAIGSFNSYLHHIFIRDESTKTIVEQFLMKKPKYEGIVIKNLAVFMEEAHKKIEIKIRKQIP